MPGESQEAERALGGVCLAVDVIQIAHHRKLSTVKPGSDQAFFMVAAYAFDLARKLEYIFKATRPFALDADPALAAEIKKDNAELAALSESALAGNWEPVAKKAEDILLRLNGEISKEHARLLDQAASQGGRK